MSSPIGPDLGQSERAAANSGRRLVGRIAGRLARTVVPRRYMVGRRGRRVRISQSTRIAGGSFIAFGDDVDIAGLCWLLVPGFEAHAKDGPSRLSIGSGTSIGEACTISAAHHVFIGSNVLFGPRVWITDHNHVYEDTTKPIKDQGWSTGGSVDIEDNCWLGTGAVVIGVRPIRIGRGSVIGANAVVTTDVSPYSVVAGNPARVISQFDSAASEWRRTDAAPRTEAQ